MTDPVVGEIYQGVGDGCWTITRIIIDRGVAQWLEASLDGGGSVQIPLHDARKWFRKRIGKVAPV
jgi:hypothetical protein